MSTEADGYLYFKLWVGAKHPRSRKPFEVGTDVVGKVLDEAKAEFPRDAEDALNWFVKWFGPLNVKEATKNE